MRNLAVLSITVAFFIVVSGTVCRAAVPEGLVLYFSFDEGKGETIEDLSGNGNTGTVMGDPGWETARKLAFGSAIYLDGAGDHIEVADSPSLGFTDAFTIEAWVNISDLTDRFLIWEDWKYTNVPKPLAVMFRVNRDGVVTLWVSPDGASVGAEDQIQTTERLKLEKWYHLAATFNAGKAVIYIDGKESVSKTLATKSIFNSEVKKHVGNYSGVPEFAAGMFDELRVWDRALSGDEVRANKEKGKDILAVSIKDSLTTTWGNIKSAVENFQ